MYTLAKYSLNVNANILEVSVDMLGRFYFGITWQ